MKPSVGRFDLYNAPAPAVFISQKSHYRRLARKVFKLNEPYREIVPSDANKPFQNELFTQGDVLADLTTMNVGNRHVFVHEEDNEILAFLMFDDNDAYFHIEFVAVNRLAKPQNSGTKLIELLAELGKTLNYTHIELFSLEQKIPYYTSLGFTDTGIPEVGHYGKTSKMVRSLD